MSARSSSPSGSSAGAISSPSRSAIEASSLAASARRSPRWAASTSAAVSLSEAAFSSTWISDSRWEQARISSAISSPSPSPPTTRPSVRSTRARIAASTAAAAAAAPCTSASRPSPSARRLRSISRWRSPSRPSARRACREARSAPLRTAPSAALAGGLGGVGGAGPGEALAGAAQPRLDLAELVLELAGAFGRRRAVGSEVEGQRARAPCAAPRAGRAISASRPASVEASTAIRCWSPRSLVSIPQALVRSRSRSAKRSSAARRRSLTSARASSRRERWARAPSATFLRGEGTVLAEAQLLGHQAPAQLELLLFDPQPDLGRLRLALQRPQAGAGLALEVEGAVEVVARRAQLELGAAAALAVLAEAGGLLDQQAALARLGVDDRLHPALADHRVHLAAEVGVGEDFDDVGEAAAGAVEAVDALAGAVERALDRDLGELARGASFGVVDHDLDLGGPAPADALAAGGDHVLHRGAADRPGALLAERPEHGVGDVRLAGAVGADDHADAGRELQPRPFGERLEPLHVDRFQIHLIRLVLEAKARARVGRDPFP